MPKLIVAVLTNLQTCHDVIHLWEELGVPGATILDSIGMRHLKERHAHRDDLPLIPSLRSVLEQEEYNHRTLFSVVPDEFDVDNLIERTEKLVGDFEAEHTGLIFVTPVLQVRGLRRHTQT
jgi:nitrogen regulatory protein P-II 1